MEFLNLLQYAGCCVDTRLRGVGERNRSLFPHFTSLDRSSNRHLGVTAKGIGGRRVPAGVSLGRGPPKAVELSLTTV